MSQSGYCFRCKKVLHDCRCKKPSTTAPKRASSQVAKGYAFCEECGTNLLDAFDAVLGWNNVWFKDWKKTATVYWSNALAGETGEVCELVKHQLGGGTKTQPKANGYVKFREELLEECADVYIYTVLLLASKGYTRDEFRQGILDKLKKNTRRMEEQERERNGISRA